MMFQLEFNEGEVLICDRCKKRLTELAFLLCDDDGVNSVRCKDCKGVR